MSSSINRRIVAWCVADAESAALFKPLFDDAVIKRFVAHEIFGYLCSAQRSLSSLPKSA
jgi:hypothetical protein